jgi:DNA-binding transcriptional ArsR family regulator
MDAAYGRWTVDVSEPASVVLPPGTAAVLRALAGTDAAFTVRRVARVAGVSHNRAHQVILRLAEHGLVLTEEQGPSKLCRLNREHLAAAAVIELVQLRARMVELLRDELAGWAVAPEHASLFGSAARGDGDTSSDLDILVVRPSRIREDDPAWAGQLVTSGQRIHAATGNHVAWFNVSRADLRRAVRAGELIVDEWRRDALRLVGNDLPALLRRAS